MTAQVTGFDWLAEALAKYPRIAIAGGPKVGKTTLSQQVADRPVIHTDDWIEAPWEDVPHIVIAACKDKPRYVVEGVQVPRALRKGLEVDAVVWLDQPFAHLNPRQVGMAKAVQTVLDGWRAQNKHVAILSPPCGPTHVAIRNTMGDR